MSNKFLNVVKTVQLANFLCVTAGSTTTFGTFAFNPVSQIPEFATFALLYDKFKLKKLRISYEPLYNTNNAVTAVDSTGVNPSFFIQSFHSMIDTNDNTAPASIAQLMNGNQYKRTRTNRPHVRMLYPKIAVDEDDAVFGTMIQAKNGWYDTAGSGATYLGLKIAIDALSDQVMLVPQTFNVYVRYWITFTEPK